MNPDFASSFKFPKSKGGGEFTVNYMEVAFNREAESGEFFLEFDEKVWEHKLIECFQAQGAGQVTTITFANNDGGDSATNALLRVMASQEKTQVKYSRGTCPPILLNKAQAILSMIEAARQQCPHSQEFDEKTAAAIKLSLETHAVKLDSIENGVCNVIPDYQKEILKLKEALAYKTAACDTIEGKLAYKTRLVNQQDLFIATMEEEHSLHVKEKQAWAHERGALKTQISGLLEQINMCKSIALLQQMQEKTQHTAEILASTLEEERACKRQRD